LLVAGKVSDRRVTALSTISGMKIEIACAGAIAATCVASSANAAPLALRSRFVSKGAAWAPHFGR
jgi:hypothetical protein